MAKRTIFLSFFLGCLISFCLPKDNIGSIPRISYVDGDVAVQGRGESGWSNVDVNLPLQEGDRLSLEKDGLVEIEMDDGSFIRLNQYSELIFQELNEKNIQLELSLGEMIIRVSKRLDYVVHTRAGNINLLDHGLFRINSEKDGSLEIIVREGQVRFSNDYMDRKVSDGRRLAVTEDGRQYVMGFINRSDDFDNWSERRESRYADCNSHRYIPSTVCVGSYDLDFYGRWVTVPNYGYCWAPTVYFSNWAPYRYGYWRQCSAWGWTWISFDPWGWLPYHYGRWAYTSSWGWVWVPGSSWGNSCWAPYLVRFGCWDNFIGWVPLGPGDYYWDNYSVINAKHQNAVTYVAMDDFRRGRPIRGEVYGRNVVATGTARSANSIAFHADENISKQLFQRDRIVVGSPKMDPMRGDNNAYHDRGRSRQAVSSGGTETISKEERNSRSGIISIGRNDERSRDTITKTNSGKESSERSSNYSKGSTQNSETYSFENRGRPGVSRGSVQDRSRSRQTDETSEYSRSNNRKDFEGQGTRSTIEHSNGTSSQSYINRGDSSRGSSRETNRSYIDSSRGSSSSTNRDNSRFDSSRVSSRESPRSTPATTSPSRSEPARSSPPSTSSSSHQTSPERSGRK